MSEQRLSPAQAMARQSAAEDKRHLVVGRHFCLGVSIALLGAALGLSIYQVWTRVPPPAHAPHTAETETETWSPVTFTGELPSAAYREEALRAFREFDQAWLLAHGGRR